MPKNRTEEEDELIMEDEKDEEEEEEDERPVKKAATGRQFSSKPKSNWGSRGGGGGSSNKFKKSRLVRLTGLFANEGKNFSGKTLEDIKEDGVRLPEGTKFVMFESDRGKATFNLYLSVPE